MQWILVAVIVITGVLNTVQSGANTTLQKTLQQPLWAFVAVSAVGLATSLLALLVSGQRFPSGQAIAAVPWWGWCGGVLGASYVLCMILTAEKVGAAVFIGVTVTAAIVTSIIMDHFGLLGFEIHRAGVARIIGGVLMAAGVGLIAAF